MISQSDDPDLPMEFNAAPTVFIKDPGPLTINFHSDGKDVGKLTFLDDGKIEFEGNTEASAAVFFEHVIALNSQALKERDERIEELEEAYARTSVRLKASNTLVEKAQERIDELEREKRDMIDELNERHRGGR